MVQATVHNVIKKEGESEEVGNQPTDHTQQIVWQTSTVTQQERFGLNGHKSCVLWLTGLSGSGKSTIAFAVERALFAQKIRSYVLDGDNIRHGLNKNLGFSKEDRQENIRRVAEVAKLFVDAGLMTIVSFISPYEEDRQMARMLFADQVFYEIYIKCPLEVCEQRDPKGLYKKARTGEISQFTGISAPYEPPVNPDFILETAHCSIEEAVESILVLVKKQGEI
ncbi:MULTISPECIES: adenylyl-sulfate kinase [Brevibacillus]|uniref:adenylyl-sulfate kinase n=1 Tax=Brevibacillus TaxID=55080 RepID=UPI001C68C3B9|nr:MULTISPECIES: adenylyl-sulfate kinase [Brevibacillus]MCR8996800.1 adenylyl-sulfate kinase [Brevibacillus laterosporus]